MPHCILEYSNNIVESSDWALVFEDVHEFLVGTGLFLIEDIKSRAVVREDFLVGDGAPDRAFVAMNLCILDGRDDEVKSLVSEGILEILKRHMIMACSDLRCSVSVRITEMQRGSYRRWASRG